MAKLTDRQITFNWVAQKETDNIGWNIYRAKSKQFIGADKINNELIVSRNDDSDYTFAYKFSYKFDTPYWFWLGSVENTGNTNLLGPIPIYFKNKSGGDIIPPENTLYQNYPNPF